MLPHLKQQDFVVSDSRLRLRLAGFVFYHFVQFVLYHFMQFVLYHFMQFVLYHLIPSCRINYRS